jgi:glycosyltransferase involved in cell wall biosynthesis
VSTPWPESTAMVISHNQTEFIVECLRSIRDQTVAPTLVILVDDGSSDDSFARGAAFVEQHFDRHVLLRHPEPLGLCRSLNEALSHSVGEYVHEIAADDYWLPHKTESQLTIFADATNDPAVVFADALLVDIDGRPLSGTFFDRFAAQGLPPDGKVFEALLRRNFLPGMSTMLRRDALLDVGGWDETLFYEDWDMWLRLADRWPFVRQVDVVAAYRYLPTSMSNARSDEMWLSKIVIARKWAGRSLRADLGWLRRTAPVSARHAAKGDLSYLREWLALGAAAARERLRNRR